jgi:purine-cytosine permease-like protein
MPTPSGMASLLFQYSSGSPGSPMLLIIIALAAVGAVTDWRYHKAGGRPSTRSDRITFGVIAVLIAGVIALTEFMGWDPYGILGYVTVPLAAWLFFAWELGRWRMRRRYPLPKTGAEPPGSAL